MVRDFPSCTTATGKLPAASLSVTPKPITWPVSTSPPRDQTTAIAAAKARRIPKASPTATDARSRFRAHHSEGSNAWGLGAIPPDCTDECLRSSLHSHSWGPLSACLATSSWINGPVISWRSGGWATLKSGHQVGVFPSLARSTTWPADLKLARYSCFQANLRAAPFRLRVTPFQLGGGRAAWLSMDHPPAACEATAPPRKRPGSIGWATHRGGRTFPPSGQSTMCSPRH